MLVSCRIEKKKESALIPMENWTQSLDEKEENPNRCLCSIKKSILGFAQPIFALGFDVPGVIRGARKKVLDSYFPLETS